VKNRPIHQEAAMQYAQIFRYVVDLPESEYAARFVDPYAQGIADFKGLVRKTWMANFETREFASFYLWESKAAMDLFMASPAVAKVAREPYLQDLVITAIPVVAAASHITRGD
jgi:hypothetical protein